MVTDQRSYVTPDGLFNLAGAMETDLRRVPRALLDEFGWTRVETLVADFDDPAVDPRSGGVIGHKAIAHALNRSRRQVERAVYNKALRYELRWSNRIPACAAQSLDVIRERLDAMARDAHLASLRGIRVL
jgi:hypothetical protein